MWGGYRHQKREVDDKEFPALVESADEKTCLPIWINSFDMDYSYLIIYLVDRKTGNNDLENLRNRLLLFK